MMEINTKDINTFEDIITKYQLSEKTLNGIKSRLVEAADAKSFSFTNLQKKAFNTLGFWRGDYDARIRHIIIQGATSSGKTLVSELAILDCLKSRKKSIVLVPLKAMVRERWENFKRDLEPQGTKQVYASSSDFQDHDGDIIKGDYEVAVIVYEKFFAMLSQSANSMLNDCELLIVDELQMLSSVNRGPKLEIGIQKVLRKNKNPEKNAVDTRIMCLTTCDCKVNYVKKWLTIHDYDGDWEPILIESPERPVSLKENVIKIDGTWKMRYKRGEHDVSKNPPEDDGAIEVLGYDEGNKPDLAKRLLLKALLQKIYMENPKAKVLIFANGRKRTYDIATYIAQQNLLPYENLSKDMVTTINSYDGDEYQRTLKETLLPHKIAFHNAALSTALREFIEDIFEKKDHLRLVVATETLTIGMNMPVDVMILLDSTVPRGNGSKAEELTSQEYKNFVGRAGRLGRTNRFGESYIFAVTENDFNRYWENYVNCRTEEIMPALYDFREKAQAPYYLSLMEPQSYDLKKLKGLWEESFSHQCNSQSIDMELVVSELKRANLCQFSISSDDDDDMDEKCYELSDFGKMMAPYAFRLETCKKIRRFFFNSGLKRIKGEWQKQPDEGKGGLPQEVTDKDIENDLYLLDILYILCCTEEIKLLSQLKIPSTDKNPEKSREALDKIELQLRKMISPENETKAICKVWDKSPLQYMLENGYVHEADEKECAMRAILLWYWTKGELISEIKRKTGFDSFVSIVNGDVARMAEVVSYQLEAIYHCYGGYSGRSKFQTKALRPLYNLSTRVNYGMPRELVIIANRHLHGLDRKTVLKIGEAAKRSGKYDSPANFLKEASVEELAGIISDQQRNALLRSIDELYMRDDLTMVLDNMQKNQGRQLSDEEYSAIVELHKVGSETENDGLLAPLEKIFITDDYIAQCPQNVESRFFKTTVRVQMIAEKSIAKISIGETVLLIGAYTGQEKGVLKYNQFISQQNGAQKNILLVKEEGTLDSLRLNKKNSVWDLLGEDDHVLVHGIHLAMTFKVFSELITQDMSLDDEDASALAAMLKDTCGVFRSAGLQAIRPLLQNYESNSNQHLSADTSERVIIRILCDTRMGWDHRSCDNIFKELRHHNIPFRVLRWGDDLECERPADAPTLLYITWDAVKSSRSLYKFHSGLRRNHYKNTHAVFESEESFKRWGNYDSDLYCYALPHSIQSDSLETIAVQAKILINNFKKNDYLIGVTYAHEKEITGIRPAVAHLRSIIKIINDAFGESRVLFDENPSCQNRFDGNGALPETLALYERCQFFIVLDDRFYDDSSNCTREGAVISEKIKILPPHHMWLLHPDNDKHCILYSKDKDYTTRLDFTEENSKAVAKDIVDYIMKEQEKAYEADLAK